jgi:polar amino acid transport system substrate-binding protein
MTDLPDSLPPAGSTPPGATPPVETPPVSAPPEAPTAVTPPPTVPPTTTSVSGGGGSGQSSRGLIIGAVVVLIAIVGAYAFLNNGSTSGGTASPSPSKEAVASAQPTKEASAAPSATATPTVAPTPDACAVANLKLVTSGKLTVGTDNPAYPPYFSDETKDPNWELGNPNNGKGFESAMAYAIADKLGFTKDQVVWVYVPFNNSYAPGAKTFDFDINQVSKTAAREETADLSDGYYLGNQALVTLKSSTFAKATTIPELVAGKFGAQVGTISYDTIVDVIKPTAAAMAYDTTDAAIAALKAKQIDGIIVDLPTADYVVNVQLDGSTIVGQFKEGTPQPFSVVLAKDSPLTTCVNTAIKALVDDGTQQKLVDQWLPYKDTPEIKP